ncbi:superoxide dismutase family protein [Allosphingosinicella sp.]|uniref:superoxide dismutase family protein n=1 Tax=Allosphingosinicella sp. TaxID=2823234 RepID=UPI00378330A9
MTRVTLMLAFVLILPAGAMAMQQQGHASATMRNAQGQMTGEALAAREGNIVRIRVTVRGFAPGTHGVHLHQIGRCDAPGFESAGPHWNPTSHQHGRLNPQGPHLGDLPNLEVGANGAGRIDFSVPVPAATAAGANPLLDADGTAVVIHAAADDLRTDPSGNSGARIACGVLTPVR